MNDAWLSDLAPQVGCLSELEIAERTMASQAGFDMSHIATCETCTQRLREQQDLYDAAAYEAVPGALLAPPPKPSMFTWPAVLGASLAMALACLLVLPGLLQKPPEAAWTQKGSVGVYATVMRGDKLLEDDELLTTIAPLHTADRVRLRVAGGVAAVTVSSWEQESWQELYQGPVDDAGWLPGSITITDTGATRLRVQVCAQARTPQSCSEQTFDL